MRLIEGGLRDRMVVPSSHLISPTWKKELLVLRLFLPLNSKNMQETSHSHAPARQESNFLLRIFAACVLFVRLAWPETVVPSDRHPLRTACPNSGTEDNPKKEWAWLIARQLNLHNATGRRKDTMHGRCEGRPPPPPTSFSSHQLMGPSATANSSAASCPAALSRSLRSESMFCFHESYRTET